MRVSVLSSGSGGNCTAIEHDGFCMLVDAGLGWRETKRRMAEAGMEGAKPSLLLLSHEHWDHSSGADVLCRRFGMHAMASPGTLEALGERLARAPGRTALPNGTSSAVGPFVVTAFSLAHDAADPSGYVIEWECGRLGIATDLGSWGHLEASVLSECTALVLEFNHDTGMLWDGPYPWPLKQRIASSRGHLSNSDAAMLVDRVRHPGLEALILAHLSRENNSPGIAEEAARSVLGKGSAVAVGDQFEAIPAMDL